MLNWRKHKIILVQILKDIFADIEISLFLGLKGGTACHFFYGLNRRSVDLDFDLLGGEKDFIFRKVEATISKYGEVKEKIIKRNTIFFLLSYGAAERNIKIEISTQGIKARFEVLSFFGIPMMVMRKEDIFANKLAALTGRRKTAIRDIYDLHYFFKSGWDINEEIVKFWTKKNLADYLKDCIKFIRKIPDSRILAGLGELIDEKQKDWAKKNLKKDLIFLMENYL